MPLDIFTNRAAVDVARLLHGRAEGTGYLCRCPVPTHGQGRGDRNPSLGVSDGRKGVVFHCFAGCTHHQVAAALEARGDLPPPVSAPIVATPRTRTTSAFARRLWTVSRPISGTLADKYLRSRGFTAQPPATIRFLPRYRYDALREFPCLIAAVQAPSREIIAVQLTFLGANGRKAPVTYPRRAIGPYADGILRLAPVAADMGIAEGFETSWAASLIHNMPVWATLSRDRFLIARIPPEVRRLTIFADNDKPGLESAEALLDARPDLETRIVAPPSRGDDWADLWERQARASKSRSNAE
jgi:hypothetical protein